MFQGMNFRKFNQFFSTEDKCHKYLYEIKWKKGYCCRRCAHDKFWRGRTKYHARCRKCNYDESVTANTVFHKIQISLRKAFSITFHLTVLKKGLSSRNLADIVDVDPKTVLFFTHKIRKAMGDWVFTNTKKASSGKFYCVDAVVLTNRSENLNGLQRLNIVMKKTRSSAKLKFIHCKGLVPDENLIDPCHLVAGKYVGEGKSIPVWNFKSWLTGVHHHCSNKNHQNYLDEFSFKFCLRNSKSTIWHTLIKWMMVMKPFEIKLHAA